jgi:transposase
MDFRQVKGMELAEHGGIKQTVKGWVVPSQTGTGDYTVKTNHEGKVFCTCPDCQVSGKKCKHQYAVEYFLQKIKTKAGDIITTKIVRKTYSQDWTAYNTAQTNEIRLFDILLKDLVAGVEAPTQEMGRPRLSLNETLFCAIQKVYSQLSQRRAHTLYKQANDKDQITHAPHFNAIGKLLNQEETTAILQNLLTATAMPLKSVETTFAQDSSGFTTSRFNQYCIAKHAVKKKHQWVKAHLLTGVKTNVIINARITEETANDCPQFKPMIEESHHQGFEIREILADKAYSSRENFEAAKEIGAMPYIPFKTNITGKARGSFFWSKMFYYFQLNREEFMEHYHKRSNAETTFQMIKSKFGEKLKSKNPTAQKNELLCKLIAHNIVVLIHEMHELGIKPDFGSSKLTVKEDVKQN